MKTFSVRNAHQALPVVLKDLISYGVKEDSRNGPVLRFPMPVTTVYGAPLERVVFHEARDANPFFHFYESLWMLDGRNTVGDLTRFVKRMQDFSDDGEHLWAAYGFRWRCAFHFDQLDQIINRLRDNRYDRRQVLAMWDAELDLRQPDAGIEWGKDLPCNTHVYFQRDNNKAGGPLNMMVCNRSNDIIMGAYGANCVHFSYLLEYIASGIGCPVGRYWQVSMNFHAYLNDVARLYQRGTLESTNDCPYTTQSADHHPLMAAVGNDDVLFWDEQLQQFMEDEERGAPFRSDKYPDPFFWNVAAPILESHRIYRETKNVAKARGPLQDCRDSAWRIACTQWLNRRERPSVGGS
jgi:thymidylate synthase